MRVQDIDRIGDLDTVSGSREIEPLNLLQAVADQHAQALWGEGCAPGSPVPLHDTTGAVCAVLFSYALGEAVHPSLPALMERVQRVQEEAGPSGETRSLERLIARYGSVTVSATRDRPPVLRASHYLHPLFAVTPAATRVAEKWFDGRPVRIGRTFFLGLHAEYLEFFADDDRVAVNLNSMSAVPIEEMQNLAEVPTVPPEWIELNLALWEGALDAEPSVIDPSLLREANVLPYWRLIPIINWTWWCAPTAFAMVLGYWDNYVKGVGVTTGYGRLIKYWFDHPKFKNNVPDLMDQMIDPSTGRWRKGFKDFSDFLNKTYGYAFKKDDVKASAGNDWAWNEIKTEIDQGRPLVWATGYYGSPHATTTFGYAKRKSGKFVKLLTTWGTTASAQRDEVVHNVCTSIGRIRPGGGDATQHLVLEGPRGGEIATVGLARSVDWFVWGTQIKKIDLYASYDGGVTWSAVAKGIKTQPGPGSIQWTPQKPTDRARVRIEGQDSKNGLVAADGSRKNFKVSAVIVVEPKWPWTP